MASSRFDDNEKQADTPLMELTSEKSSDSSTLSCESLLRWFQYNPIMTGLSTIILVCLCIVVVFELRHSSSSTSTSTVVGLDPQILSLVQQAVSPTEETNLQNVVNNLVNFGTRNTMSDASRLNTTFGIGASALWLKSQMDSLKSINPRIITEFDDFLGTGSYAVNMTNVIATIPGTDPGDTRIFMVGGHYDSRSTDRNSPTTIAPGADDDASGTAVVLESLRLLAKYDFPATIVFVAFTGEEQGLLGSQHLAQVYRNQSRNLVALLNYDIVGGQVLSSETNLSDYTHLRVFSVFGSSGQENDSPQRQLARYVKETSENYTRALDIQWDIELIYRADRYNRGGDQTSFNNQGFPSVRLTEMNENYDHQHQDVRVENGIQYGDLSKYCVWSYLSKVLATNVATLANMALAPGQPTQVVMLTSGLSNLSTFRWQPPKDGANRVAGYNLLIRKLASPIWESRLSFNSTTLNATIAFTKDNFLFALQTFDSLNHQSVPVFPTPVSS